MKINLSEIKGVLNKNSDLLRNKYCVTNLGVFGSVVRADNTDTSDIDILVEFSQPVGFFKFIELEKFLSQLLGKKVDLVTRKALKSAIKNEILRETSYV